MILGEDADHAGTFELPGNGFVTPAAVKEVSSTVASKAQPFVNAGPRYLIIVKLSLMLGVLQGIMVVVIGRRFIIGLTMFRLILLRFVFKRSRIIRKESLCLSR